MNLFQYLIAPKKLSNQQKIYNLLDGKVNRYRIEVGVVLNVEHVAYDLTVSSIETGLSGSPESLKYVLHRFLGVCSDQ